MTSVDISVADKLFFTGALSYLCNRKNCTMVAYQWLGLYSSVNFTGEESDE